MLALRLEKELDAKLLDWMKRTGDKLPPAALKW